MPAQRRSRLLQRTLLAFFCLSVLFLVVIYVAAPSIYTNTLSTHALSDRALPRGRNTLAGGRWGVSRHCDDRRPAPLALSCSGLCWWLSVG